jgi:hypothetical protein
MNDSSEKEQKSKLDFLSQPTTKMLKNGGQQEVTRKLGPRETVSR